MATQPRDYALVIGIDDYPEFRNLSGARGDADDFAKWLTDTEIGGGLPDTNCELVVSKSNPLVPFQHDVDVALRNVWQLARKSGGRRFYFYFSGHGLSPSSDAHFLCLAGWSEIFRYLALDSNEYLKLIVESGLFSEVAVFLDCCRVRIPGTGGLRPTLGWPIPAASAGQTRKFVAAGTEFQNKAFEAELAGATPLPLEGPLIRGHFTRALLCGLWGDAAERQGGVKASQLKKRLEELTFTFANEHGQDQKSEVMNGFVGEPLFGNALPRESGIAEVRFQPSRAGKIELIGPDAEVVKAGDAATGPWRLVLSRGAHILREERTSAKKSFYFYPLNEVNYVEF
jgi:hypothetical protein